MPQIGMDGKTVKQGLQSGLFGCVVRLVETVSSHSSRYQNVGCIA